MCVYHSKILKFSLALHKSGLSCWSCTSMWIYSLPSYPEREINMIESICTGTGLGFFGRRRRSANNRVHTTGFVPTVLLRTMGIEIIYTCFCNTPQINFRMYARPDVVVTHCSHSSSADWPYRLGKHIVAAVAFHANIYGRVS